MLYYTPVVRFSGCPGLPHSVEPLLVVSPSRVAEIVRSAAQRVGPDRAPPAGQVRGGFHDDGVPAGPGDAEPEAVGLDPKPCPSCGDLGWGWR